MGQGKNCWLDLNHGKDTQGKNTKMKEIKCVMLKVFWGRTTAWWAPHKMMKQNLHPGLNCHLRPESCVFVYINKDILTINWLENKWRNQVFDAQNFLGGGPPRSICPSQWWNKTYTLVRIITWCLIFVSLHIGRHFLLNWCRTGRNGAFKKITGTREIKCLMLKVSWEDPCSVCVSPMLKWNLCPSSKCHLVPDFCFLSHKSLSHSNYKLMQK